MGKECTNINIKESYGLHDRRRKMEEDEWQSLIRSLTDDPIRSSEAKAPKATSRTNNLEKH